MPKRKAASLTDDAAAAQFYRGQLLSAILLSPADFFDAIIPLYNRLNGTYVIGGVKVEYSEVLFVTENHGMGGDSDA